MIETYNCKQMNEIEQDYVKSAEWFRKAAEQGDPTGQVCLAQLYDEGKGVPQDYAEAAKWYEKAAEKEVKSAQSRLGEMYDKGLGVSQDSAKAAYWSKKGVVFRCMAFNWGTMAKRKTHYDKLNEVIEKVTESGLKDSLIKIRDEYWKRIGQLNKPNYTDDDYEQIHQEQKRMEKLISRMGELIKAEQL